MAIMPNQSAAIAALLAQRQQGLQQQVPPPQAPAPGYSGGIPAIAQAFQNDPRTRLANSMLAQGSSTAPVAAGGWAWADGLARIAQGVAGGLINKKQEKKFAEREQQYMEDLRNAYTQPAPNPAVENTANVNPGQMPQQAAPVVAQAAQALAPPQPQQAPPMGRTPQMPPQMPPPLSQGAQAAPQGLAGGPGMVGGVAGLAQMPQAVPQAAMPQRQRTVSGVDPRTLYFKGIVPIEGGTDPKTGAFRTSPKGAVGPGQVMPGTAPEAARLAGVPFDERLYRSDAEYNNKLGLAYFTKQLQDFGDPVLAAAAYNGGPGRVRRALRMSAKQGTEWTQHLPGETRDYVQKFSRTLSSDDGLSMSGGETINEDVSAPPAQGVAPPQLEQVPGQLQVPTAKPQAPALPEQIQSRRLEVGRRMLASNNPYLVQLAQGMLDQGMSDEFEAQKLTNTQQFARDNMGYQTDLGDYADARSSGRQQAMAERTNAQARNFAREQTYTDQKFTAAENNLNRMQQATLASQDQQFRKWMFGAEQDRIDAREAGKTQKNPWFDTVGGMNLRTKIEKENEELEKGIQQVEQFLQLNQGTDTGGILGYESMQGIGKAFGSKNLATMDSIAKDAALAKLGGSLGVAISDGDRKWVGGSTIGIDKPGKDNENIGKFMVAGMRRKQDYNYWKMMAEANMTQSQFATSWREYAKAVPIVRYERGGKVIIDQQGPSYEQWMNRPKYDANGKAK